jgi:hypothetical protein
MRSAHLPLILALTACGALDPYSASNIGMTVKPLESGLYIVSYRELEVIDAYGPGVDQVRREVEHVKTSQESEAVWHRAHAVAVPKYLASKGIVPAECRNGVEVTASGSTENGGGWSHFRCKPA